MTSVQPETLARAAANLIAPSELQGARLIALLPCEPAVGEVAVACWQDAAGAELIELVRLPGGESIADSVALREALALLAMVETLEELASFDVLAPAARELRDWQGDGEALTDQFSRAREAALTALAQLEALAPGDAPRVARPALLDSIGGALRELERAWELLEQAAEAWSDALLASRPGDGDALALVQGLWRLLGAVRRGPLAQPPSTALHAGREAGIAMAASISAQ